MLAIAHANMVRMKGIQLHSGLCVASHAVGLERDALCASTFD